MTALGTQQTALSSGSSRESGRLTPNSRKRSVVTECGVPNRYNRKRQHSTLGYRLPIQFMENLLSEQKQEKLVA